MEYIHEYVYNKSDKHSKNRRIIGVLATSHSMHENTIGVGWALCNKVDKFDRSRGLFIAKGRAHKLSSEFVPDSIIDDYRSFTKRCHRYYKDKLVINAYTPRQ
jgi:hypothetical protein